MERKITSSEVGSDIGFEAQRSVQMITLRAVVHL